MFIYSVRASTLKFAAVLTLGVILVTAMVIFLPSGEPGEALRGDAAVNYDNIENAEDMARFLGQFGIVCEGKTLTDKEVMLPTNFDGVFAEYNALQKRQGMDLAPFAGKKLRQVTLVVKRTGEDKKYLATLYIYRNCVVGGDISDADPKGGTWSFDEWTNTQE